MRIIRNTCFAVMIIAFVAVIGTVGGLEREMMTTGQTILYSAIGLAAMAGCGIILKIIGTEEDDQ